MLDIAYGQQVFVSFFLFFLKLILKTSVCLLLFFLFVFLHHPKRATNPLRQGDSSSTQKPKAPFRVDFTPHLEAFFPPLKNKIQYIRIIVTFSPLH